MARHNWGYESRQARKAAKEAAEKAFIAEHSDEIKEVLFMVKNHIPEAGSFATLKRQSKITMNEILQNDVNSFVSEVMNGKEDAKRMLTVIHVTGFYDTRSEAMEHKGFAGGYENDRYGWEGWKDRVGVCQVSKDSNKWTAYQVPTSGQLRKAAINYLHEKYNED